MGIQENGKRLPVSVVIPAHNAEVYIEETLRSIKAQTTQPYEVIVVDDGSVDRTGDLAEAFGVTVIRQPQRGISAARNAAIARSTQTWIAFLDADDLWEPLKLEKQWLAVESCPGVGAVFTDFVEFNAKGILGAPFLTTRINFEAIKRFEVAPSISCCDGDSFQDGFLDGNFIAPSTFLVRRDLLQAVAGFDEAISHCEDRDLYLRLLAKTTMAVVEIPLMKSRIHERNWSSNKLKMALGVGKILDKIIAQPEIYPSRVVERYRFDEPELCLNIGRLFEEAGDRSAARDYFVRSWRTGGALRPLVLALLLSLPDPIRRLVRSGLASSTSPVS